MIKMAATFFLVAIAAFATAAHSQSVWSTSQYDLYPGDFNGDGKSDLLYVAVSPNNESGIALSDGTRPVGGHQVWTAGAFGIPWHSRIYVPVIGDFNWDGRSDIFMHRQIPGDHYLLLSNSDGTFSGIAQTVANGSDPLAWSGDKHRAISVAAHNPSDSAHPRGHRLFMQAVARGGSNALITTSFGGLIGGVSGSPWIDGYQTFQWNLQQSLVHSGDFNGDGNGDLLIQAKPDVLLIDYDVPIPVPRYRPQSFGIVFSPIGSAGYQMWDRMAGGADWSATHSNLVIADVDGNGRDDVLLQPRRSAANARLVLGSHTTNQLAVSSSVSVSFSGAGAVGGDSYRILAGNFDGGAAGGVYLQSTSPGTSDLIASSIPSGGGVASTTSQSQTSQAPVSNAVGSLPGNAGVSATGAATYQIPLWLPPGINDLQPELALGYSSHNGDGHFGAGWALQGISAIARCVATKAQNGTPRDVRNDANDRFCLDDNQLRRIAGTYADDGSEYRTEIETFSRIKAHGTSGTPSHFSVERKDGLKYEYGNTSDSQVLSLGQTQARVWAVNRISDKSGNAITFSYTEDATNGGFRVNEIHYTSNAGAGLSARNKVRFAYEALPVGEKHLTYQANSIINQVSRVDKIEVLYDNVVIRYYDLTYEALSNTNKSRLASIQTCTTALQCLPATTFAYQNGTPGLSSQASSPNNVPLATRPLSIDVNGDGRKDLIYSSSATSGAGSWKQALANSSGNYDAATNASGSAVTNTNFSKAIPIDYDANGFDDLLLPKADGTWAVMLGSTTGLGSPQNTGIAMPTNGRARAIDVDGDGWQDLVYTEEVGYAGGDNLSYRLRVPAGTFGSPVSVTTLTADSQINDAFGPIHSGAPDFNGDGRGDMMFRYTTRTPKAGGGYNFQTRLVAICPGGPTYVTDMSTSTSPQFGDLNGDGRTDLFYIVGGTSAQHRMRLSTGTSFTAEIPGPSANSYGLEFILDWDGDGMDDLVARALDDTFYLFRSQGNGLAAPVSTGITNGFNMGGVTPIDLNGDGLADLAYWDETTNWRIRLHNGVMPDLLTSVTDGFGMTTSFGYAPLTTANYTKYADATAPEQDYIGSMHVVATVMASTAIASPSTFSKTYHYRGARMSLVGRGFLGFDQIRSQDSRNSLWEYSYFKRAFPHIGVRYKQSIYKSDATTLIDQAEHRLTQFDYTSQPESSHFPFVDRTTTGQYEINGTQLTSVVQDIYVDQATGTSYDIRTKRTELASANGLQSGAEYNQRVYHAALTTDTTHWCLGMPSETQLINSHTQTHGGSITRTVHRSWDTAKCRMNSETLQQGDTQWAVTTALTYDDALSESDPDVGHVTKVEVTGAGMTDARVTTLSWAATQGRFLSKVSVKARANPSAVWEETQYQWDGAKGVPTKAIDPNGLELSWSYDNFGRRIREGRPDGTAATWSFNRCAGTSCIGDSTLRWYVHSTELANGGSIINSADKYFDAAGRVRYEDTPTLTGVSRVVSTYDSLGRLSQQSLPYLVGSTAFLQTFAHDVANRVTNVTRPVSATDPAPQTTLLTYNGLTTSVQDALGRVETRVMNAVGLTARSQDAASYYQNFTYDAFGNLKSVTDSASNTLQEIGYNVRGMKTSLSDMDAGGWTYRPNALGEVEFIRDAKTSSPLWTTEMTYDLAGRMITRKDVPENVTSTFTFGTTAPSIGRLTQVSGGGHTEDFEYYSTAFEPSIGKLKKRTITSDATYVIDYSYNALGLLDVLQYPTSTSSYRFAVKHEYANGFLSSVRDNQAPGTQFWRASGSDAFGNVTNEQLGNGLQTTRGFDAVTGALASIQTVTVNAPSTSIQNLTYTWDKVGNLKQRRDVRQSLTEEFYYDNVNRLDCSTLNVSPAANCAALTGQMNLNVDYDQLGNITHKSDVGGTGNYTYDAFKKHQVTGVATGAGNQTFGYDANGNMDNRNGSTISWYSYNLPKLINGSGGSSSQFYYTAERDRWKQVASYGGTAETTIYIGGLIEKVTLGSVTSWRHYVASGAGPVAVYTRKDPGASELHYLTRDHLGSVDSVTDVSGAPEVRLSFSAFGARRKEAGWSGNPTAADWTEITDTTRRGFTFHEMLDNLNLTHMNGRVYDQTIGRFLSADPYVPSPDFTQSYNRYSYVHNNPLSFTDPSGFMPSPDDDPSPGFCNRICIDINIDFDFGFGFPFGMDLWGLRTRLGTPPPLIRLRGGATVVPVKNLETDIAGGEVKRKGSTAGGNGTWGDFAFGVARGAADDVLRTAIIAGAVQSLYRGDFINAYIGLRYGPSAELFGAPDSNRGQFGYDLGPAATVAVGGLAGTARSVAARGAATIIEHAGNHASVIVRFGNTVLHTEQVVLAGGRTTIAAVEGAAPVVRSLTVSLPDAAAAIRYQRSVLGQATGTYNLATNSCVTHCGDVLRAGGLEAPTTTRAIMRWLRGLSGD